MRHSFSVSDDVGRYTVGVQGVATGIAMRPSAHAVSLNESQLAYNAYLRRLLAPSL